MTIRADGCVRAAGDRPEDESAVREVLNYVKPPGSVADRLEKLDWRLVRISTCAMLHSRQAERLRDLERLAIVLLRRVWKGDSDIVVKLRTALERRGREDVVEVVNMLREKARGACDDTAGGKAAAQNVPGTVVEDRSPTGEEHLDGKSAVTSADEQQTVPEEEKKVSTKTGDSGDN